MRISDNYYNFSLRLLYAGFYRVGTWWNYQNVVSPFSRLYLITQGQATVYINRRSYVLNPGELFLIPAFMLHSYACEGFMEHFIFVFFMRRSVTRTSSIACRMNCGFRDEIDRGYYIKILPIFTGRIFIYACNSLITYLLACFFDRNGNGNSGAYHWVVTHS